MADQFDKWRPTSDTGRNVKAVTKYVTEGEKYDHNLDKTTIGSCFVLARELYNLFNSK